MRHFDEQILGGIALHKGKIAEMKTGEGKTLVATLPAYLNALTGNGVHIITVNDYLANRDCKWMYELYKFLGLETGVILSGKNIEDKKTKSFESETEDADGNLVTMKILPAFYESASKLSAASMAMISVVMSLNY